MAERSPEDPCLAYIRSEPVRAVGQTEIARRAVLNHGTPIDVADPAHLPDSARIGRDATLDCGSDSARSGEPAAVEWSRVVVRDARSLEVLAIRETGAPPNTQIAALRPPRFKVPECRGVQLSMVSAPSGQVL